MLSVLSVSALFMSACGTTPENTLGAGLPTSQPVQTGAARSSPREYFGRTPRCRSDLIYAEQADFGTDLPGGPQTPEDAVKAHLLLNYPNLLVDSFTRPSDSSQAAEPSQRAAVFVHDDADAGELMLLAEVYGDSWSVTATKACSDEQNKERKK